MKVNLGIRDYTTEELVQGCLEGKRTYQRMLYQKYAPEMFGICLHYASDRDQAKDILQNGFIKVFTSLEQYQSKGSLGGWIRKIITHTAIDHYRKQKKLRNYIDQEAEPDDGLLPEDILSQIHAEKLMEWVNRLPEGARTIFNLHTLEGYNHREISEILNITSGTSKSQLNRAKYLLKKWILSEQ